MIPCLGVLVMNRADLLTRLVHSIDHPVERLCIVQNGCDDDVDNTVHRIATEKHPYINQVYVNRPFRNMGVAPSWNHIIKSFPECSYWLISNNDTLFLPGDLAKIHATWYANQDSVITAPNGAFSCFAIGPSVVEKVGLFDENIWPIYSEDLDYIIRMERTGVPLVPLDSDTGEANNGSWTIRSSETYRAANGTTQARNGEYLTHKWGPDHSHGTPFDDPSRRAQDWHYLPGHRQQQSQAWNHMEATANRCTAKSNIHNQPVLTSTTPERLSDIISRMGLVTDKNSLHSYCDHFYEAELARYRDRPVQVVEIGIDQGGSLMLWAEAIPRARVLGVDLQLRGDCERNCAAYGGRIQFSLGNAYMPESLVHFPKADIVIDDGPHSVESQVFAAQHFPSRINPGGILVIEDIVSIEAANTIMSAVPPHLRAYAAIIDLRYVKGRDDDIMLVVRIPETTVSIATDRGKHLLRQPTGLSMDMMAERLSHIENLIDFNNIKNIIDVGAAHGYESKNLARVFTNAHIWAFEPTDEHFQHCLGHFAGLDHDLRPRIHIENLALNDIGGTIKFYPLDTSRSIGNNTGMASKFRLMDPGVFPHELSIQREITVEAVTLDQWCQERDIQPDLIWMDAQGAELDILRGAGTVLRGTKVIMTEAALKPYYHGHTLKADIDAFLGQLGFTELVSARKTGHEYEVDTIYLRQA
jgi:FkbM family methyltransferase